ncbi:Aste57867_1812 [Aphanomyces stellatus]|uniref:Aste57867_1812 protein n=1 Tax=Aphanomyces stellatus TaxID=120398 RepID=A0A485K6M1_9STRA|nr:hypothetical protein As57867_001810 [Aphanomyces stellatus]VFT79021.1 Aste57867_1812 [Aphanomyces stellatus]
MDRLDARRDAAVAIVRHVTEVVQANWLAKSLVPLWRVYMAPRWHWVFVHVTGTVENPAEKYWAKDKLTTNDVYRDRLLAKEIAMLVSLTEALGMSGPQRHSLFETFLHLDWMRRSAITVQDLFLYCGLRRSRFADCVLSLPAPQDGFRKFANRFEIVQLTTALFNICTLPAAKLVEWVLAQAKEDVVVQSLLLDSDKTPPLRLEIAQLLLFVVGTLNPNETYLKSALEALYLTTPVDPTLDFAASHGMTTIAHFLERFPVLIYPIFWIQRTLRRRILGTKFWARLQEDRARWGTTQVFYRPEELMDQINACKIPDEEKPKDDEKEMTPRQLAKVLPVASAQDNGKATPSLLEKSQTDAPWGCAANISAAKDDAYSFAQDIQAYPNEVAAWQVTADNLLAAVHIKQKQLDCALEGMAVPDEYIRVTKSLANGTVTPTEATDIRKSIVKQYGYQFADFIVGFSHIKDVMKHVPKHTKQKGKGKKSNLPLNWEKLYDPKEKRHFYYNALTGESDWEPPRSLRE